MEIVTVEPMVMNRGLEPGIKAGMMAVIPHFEWDRDFSENSDNAPEPPYLPNDAVICGGQVLSRELYPELSQIFSGGGGFYEFTLPDLVGRFIIGVKEDGTFQMGDGIVYYRDNPQVKVNPRSVTHMPREG